MCISSSAIPGNIPLYCSNTKYGCLKCCKLALPRFEGFEPLLA